MRSGWPGVAAILFRTSFIYCTGCSSVVTSGTAGLYGKLFSVRFYNKVFRVYAFITKLAVISYIIYYVLHTLTESQLPPAEPEA